MVPAGSLDVVGLGLVSAGLFGLVWGVIHGNDRGWGDPQIVARARPRRRS